MQLWTAVIEDFPMPGVGIIKWLRPSCHVNKRFAIANPRAFPTYGGNERVRKIDLVFVLEYLRDQMQQQN